MYSAAWANGEGAGIVPSALATRRRYPARFSSPSSGDADSTVPARAVVRGAQVTDHYPGRLVLRVDEPVVADVDADVRQPGFVCVLEEDEVAWLQLAAADRRASVRLRPEAIPDVLADHVLDHPVGEAGAVERVWPMRRPAVGIALISHGVADDGVPGRGASAG